MTRGEAGVGDAVMHPPAAPGPDAEAWRCRCGNLLGFVAGRWLFSRHRGRTVVGGLPARVQCEKCGHQNARGPGS